MIISSIVIAILIYIIYDINNRDAKLISKYKQIIIDQHKDLDYFYKHYDFLFDINCSMLLYPEKEINAKAIQELLKINTIVN